MNEAHPGPDVQPRLPGREPGAAARWGSPAGYAVSLALTALVTLLGRAIFVPGSITNIGLLFLLPVMVAATRYGLRTGIVTSLASSLAYNFFFIPPTHTFHIEDPQHVITVLVLLAVAVAGSELASRAREQALMAEASAAQSRALADFARQLTAVGTVDALAKVLCEEFRRLLHANTVLLVPGESGLAIRSAAPFPADFEMFDRAAANWCHEHAEPAGRGTARITTSEWLFHPVGGPGEVMAVIGLSRPDARPPVRADRMPLLLGLMDHAALALGRIALSEEKALLARGRDRDRLRHALLSSVSHDLRTPLTTILGTLNAMQPHDEEQAGQLAEARAEAERLHRFVANLLDMVRIEAGALRQSTEPVDLAEAVASALDDTARTLGGCTVTVAIPADLPLVLVDPQLFHHCLINLIDNAAKHGGSGGTIEIAAARHDTGIELSVMDRGIGIPAGEEARIFGVFTRLEGSDRTGGTGLGLAIVQGFAQAMGLTVRAAARSDGPGARFTIGFDAATIRELGKA